MKKKYLKEALSALLAFSAVISCAGCGAVKTAEPAPEIIIASPLPSPETQENEKTDGAAPKTIEIFGQSVSEAAEEISITADVADPFDLADAIEQLPGLKRVDLSASGIFQSDALALSRHFKDIEFLYNVTVLGVTFPSDSTELDFSNIPLEDSREIEASLEYFPKLEKVVMCDCGLSDEYMDELNHRYEDIKFVWMVHFNIYSLRTDTTYFCAADVPGQVAPELYTDQMQPLKYCTDMEALDIGHMNYDSLDFIAGMTKLKYLIAVQGKFSDISVVANFKDLYYCELFTNNRIVDITPLLECKNLKHLNLGYCYYLDWRPLMQMTQLERLWLPHVGLDDDEKEELAAALPNTQIHMPLTDPMGSTGAGWREDQSYFDMRDAMHMYYLPGGTGMDVS